MRTFLLLLLAAPAAAASPDQLWSRSAALFDGLKAVRPEVFVPPAPTEGEPMKLSELARELQKDPKAVDALIDLLLNKSGELGRAFQDPTRRAKLEAAVRSADASVLDRFPVLTAPELLAASRLYASRQKPAAPEPVPAEETLALTGLPKDPGVDDFHKELGFGLVYGDEAQLGKASAFGDSVALSRVLNRLADNDPAKPAYTLRYDGAAFTSVRAFLEHLLRSGTTLGVESARYYANFGDLRFRQNGRLRAVATPFYVDTGVILPSGRKVVVPVTHSHVEIALRGKVAADLTFFLGVDGAASFRADATVDQSWVGGRKVASWSGAGAVELLERAAFVRRGLGAKAKAAKLPLGGYGPLGDCNDAHALFTGETPYPMIREPQRFLGASLVDQLSRALPYDLVDAPSARRLLESRPFDDLDRIPFPEVREGLRELRTLAP